MPTIVYSGSVSEATGLNDSPSVSLSGSGDASGIINSVKASLTFSTNAYGNYYSVTATLSYTGGSATANRSIKMDSSNYTSGKFDFTFSGLTVEQANSITDITVTCSNNATKIFLKGSQTVTIDYLPVSATGAPTKLTLGAESAAPGAKVTLSWSGAKAGDNNSIAGYSVYRSDEADGDYSLLSSVSSNTTSGSLTVTAPTTNGDAYYYKVATVGAQDGYDSDMSVTYATLTCSFNAVGAPTSVSISTTNVSPGASVTLSWSGATVGDNNLISGFKIYRSEHVDGPYLECGDVSFPSPGAHTSGSYDVTAPSENGVAHYFKVQTLGELSNSDLSSAYTALSCTYSSPSAPTTFTANGVSEAYVLPGERVVFRWSGASSGANNPIMGYTMNEDGVYSHNIATTSPTAGFTHTAQEGNPGEMHTYEVYTRGKYSNSAMSKSVRVYIYTDPKAPSLITVSDDSPLAGGRVVLSWSGAEAGGWNDVAGYRVYRSSSPTGSRTQVAHVVSTDTHASCYVTAPATVGGQYYYWVETVGSHSMSGASDVYAAVRTSAVQEEDSDGTVVIVPPLTKRKKRGFIFGDYDTAVYGWTLTGWEFPEPEAQTSYVNIPGRVKGPLDLSTALTDGDPRYGSRELTAIFENSEGTRLERDEIISTMTNLLHGVEVEIVFPDDPSRYAVGRLSVRLNYSDMAHAEVSIQAVCEPWRYSQQEAQISLMVAEDENTAVLSNAGRCILVPEVHVVGTGSRVKLSSGSYSWTLTEGVHRLPDLTLRKGNTFIKYSGIGTLVFKYREAIL